MSIIYNSQELIPAPLVDISKQYIRNETGAIIYADYKFTLRGTIVNVGNSLSSPDAVGHSFGNMEGILAEQKRIRSIFSYDGGRLEISSPDGGPNTIDALCTVESLNFSESTWTTRCEYTIVLGSEQILNEDPITDYLRSMSENVSVSENEDGTHSIVHRAQAVGLSIYTDPQIDPLQKAKAWCQSKTFLISKAGHLTSSDSHTKINFGNIISNINSSGTNFWNYSLAESIGTTANSWEITESFIHNPSGNYLENWTVSLGFEPNDTKKCSISINGNVAGFSDRTSSLSDRNANAKDAFEDNVEPNIYSRANSYAPTGFVTSLVPTSKQISYERTNGSLRYGYVYNSILGGTLIPNSVEESIQISDQGMIDIFAQIAVPGRSSGPVIQYMNTSSAPERTVNISATIVGSGSAITLSNLRSQFASKPNTSAIISALRPSSGKFYMKQNSEDWNPIRRQYSRTISWIMEQVDSGTTPSGINNV
jgi:hypothetical protein